MGNSKMFSKIVVYFSRPENFSYPEICEYGFIVGDKNLLMNSDQIE